MNALVLKYLPSKSDLAHVADMLRKDPRAVPELVFRYLSDRRIGFRGDDPISMASVMENWRAAHRAGAFVSSPYPNGRALAIIGSGEAAGLAPTGAKIVFYEHRIDCVTEVQFASSVAFVDVPIEYRAAALSLEAARHALPQSATDPGALEKKRGALLRTRVCAGFEAGLMADLKALAAEPIVRLRGDLGSP